MRSRAFLSPDLRISTADLPPHRLLPLRFPVPSIANLFDLQSSLVVCGESKCPFQTHAVVSVSKTVTYDLPSLAQPTMGLPFEALLPYGIMVVVCLLHSLEATTMLFLILANLSTLQMFGITGAGLSTSRWIQNGGKPGRHAVDQWDRVRLHQVLPNLHLY